ncbi:hypothetical protein SteCoe_29824 [Stentor coeruleus]|uniref:Uncharacterized protein n=1 Tax=Stentor coeruleus TaxID=5963 RepID=A0A1R2B4Y9_9CILI|nr:hypothetical protein SteCoe_29824 [Stentor coeruleus]
MESQESDIFLKISLVGSEKTGKSSLFLRYFEDNFNCHYSPTLGVDFRIKTISSNNKTYKLQLWDIAGQERFKSLSPSYFKGSQFILILYQPSDRDSFNNLTKWAEFIKANMTNDYKILIVENEFFGIKRVVSRKESKNVAKKLESELVRVNTKTGVNVNKLFETILDYSIGERVTWPDIEYENDDDLLSNEETENFETQDILSVQEENNEQVFLYKVILVGDSGTGKSSIISCLSCNYFTENYIPTVGIEFKIISFHINNSLVKLQVWDTAGQEKHRPIIPAYYKGSNCIIIIYNSHNRKKFENITNWLEDIDRNAPENCYVVLLENEFDNYKKQVEEHEGPELANKFDLHYFKSNLKNGHQIQSLFSNIAKILINSTDIKRPNYINIINKNSMTNEVKSHVNNYDYFMNLIIIGDSGTGKSSLLLRYSDDVFSESYISTIGIDFKVCSLKIEEKNLEIKIWDTAGDEKFRTITFYYYKNAHVIMIVYDASNRKSFDNLGYWIEMAHKYTEEKFLMCLVENARFDMVRQVENFEGEEIAKKENAVFFKVDVKTKEGVDELFEKCARKAMEDLIL